MMRRLSRRFFVMRVVHATWRYRDRLDSQGDQFQRELATALRTTIDDTFGGMFALRSYRLAMRLLVVGVIGFVLLALIAAVGLWQLHPFASLVAAIVVLPAIPLLLWRLSWGAPLDWLDEHADPDRRVPIGELPTRLRELASQSRRLANVPARFAEELEVLAADRESARVGHDASG